VVPKVKQFVWRMAHNSLPLKLSIKRRGVECNTLCVCCRKFDEDGAHLFLKCKEVKKCWKLIKMEVLHDHMCTFTTADSVVQEILNLQTDDRTLVVCMLWQWWSARNKLNSEGQQLSVEAVVRQAQYWASESEQFC
jgi:hypothetical protein